MGSNQSVIEQSLDMNDEFFPGLFGSKQQTIAIDNKWDYPHENCAYLVDILSKGMDDTMTEPMTFENMESDLEMKFLINSPSGKREVTYQIKNGEIVPVHTKGFNLHGGASKKKVSKKEVGMWDGSDSDDSGSSNDSSLSVSSSTSSSDGKEMRISNSSIHTSDVNKMKKVLFSDEGKQGIDDFPSDDVYEQINRFNQKSKLFSSTDDSILDMGSSDGGNSLSSSDKYNNQRIKKNDKYA